MIEINPGDARGAVGFNLSGAECTGTHFNCENYNNGTCIQLNSAGNLIQGGYVESTGGKLLNDTNNLGNLNVGNTVILGGAIQEWYGRYGKGNNQGGIPILVAAVSQRVSSGSSISSTPLYTDPVSGDSSMYQIHYTVVTAGGGTGTVTVSYAANIPGIGFTGACSTTLSLSGANTISEGSCSVMSVGGGLSYASSGGSGAGYTVYTRVMKIG
jgi:hypothetical protein